MIRLLRTAFLLPGKRESVSRESASRKSLGLAVRSAGC
jgi:hypothetical protein